MLPLTYVIIWKIINIILTVTAAFILFYMTVLVPEKEAKEKQVKDMTRFLDWCNAPVYIETWPGKGKFYCTRVVAQHPDYKKYNVFDSKGESILPEGKLLTSKEVYDYWKDLKSINVKKI